MKMINVIIAIMLVSVVLPSALAATMRVYPSDDAYVRDTSPSENFASGDGEDDLRVGFDASFGTDRSFLKFDLSGLNGLTINSASLSLKPNINSDNPVVDLYYSTDDSWSEGSITWTLSPNSNTLTYISSSAPIVNNDRVDFNVGNYIDESDNVLSFSLRESGENAVVQFFSKDLSLGSPDDSALWPYIEVDYVGSCTTGADTNGNEIIEMLELLNYISEWKTGSVQMLDLLNAISYWKAGAGC